ncbi:MAG: hypothetical protein HZB38_07560 [Planctomycetes bacterium]|nr:hypothetical protein [Planctomycetota bacterium]
MFPNRSAIEKSCHYGDVHGTPLGPPAAACFIVSVLLGVLRCNRLPANLCLNCEYDLRGSPSGICPECGQRAFAAAVP